MEKKKKVAYIHQNQEQKPVPVNNGTIQRKSLKNLLVLQISQLPVLLTFLRLPKLLSFHIFRLAEKKKKERQWWQNVTDFI